MLVCLILIVNVSQVSHMAQIQSFVNIDLYWLYPERNLNVKCNEVSFHVHPIIFIILKIKISTNLPINLLLIIIILKASSMKEMEWDVKIFLKFLHCTFIIIASYFLLTVNYQLMFFIMLSIDPFSLLAMWMYFGQQLVF